MAAKGWPWAAAVEGGSGVEMKIIIKKEVKVVVRDFELSNGPPVT